MSHFTFYVEGVGRDVIVTANTEKEAHKLAWESLTDDEKNACACLDCVDEVAA